MRRNYLLLLLLSVFIISCSRPKFVNIGSGSLTGVYFPLASALSSYLNSGRKIHHIKCTPEATGGSVFNINALLRGDLDFGISQSDRLVQAWRGEAEWKIQGPRTNLRAVFTLHPESITLAAADDSGIRTIADLKGHRVNIGNVGSGVRQNALDVLSVFGIDAEKDIKAENAKAAEAPTLMQDGRVDSFFFTVGHPNGNIKEACIGDRKLRFISIPPGDWMTNYPWFRPSVIPVKHYPGSVNKQDVDTVGVVAVLITSEETDEEVVYRLTRSTFEHFDDLRMAHPALEALTRSSMLAGAGIPFHTGALRYFKEMGFSY